MQDRNRLYGIRCEFKINPVKLEQLAELLDERITRLIRMRMSESRSSGLTEEIIGSLPMNSGISPNLTRSRGVRRGKDRRTRAGERQCRY
jgi:hypothetical protein